MSQFTIFDIAGSAMTAQTVRLNTVASNLANANSVSGNANDVYRARYPVFQAVPAAQLDGGSGAVPAAAPGGGAGNEGVAVAGIVQSQAPAQMRYDPGNPLANAQGYVYQPDVNAVQQMADMISASRSYQDDVQMLSTARDLMLATLKLGA